MKTTIKLLFAAFLLLSWFFLSACTSTTYTAPNGVKFSRTAFMNKQSIGKVTFNPSTGELQMEGYSNEQTEVAAAVANAVAGAITKAYATPK